MKKLLALGLVALMATVALADPTTDDMIGMFFSNVDFSDASTNVNPAAAPFNAYIVILDASVPSVAAYEVGLMLSDPTVFILGVVGPNGWTNLGSPTNHIVGYATPVPCADGQAVLATMTMLYTGVATVEISMGPATPSSFGGMGPGIANGDNVNHLVECGLTVPREPCGNVECRLVSSLTG
jgi:hypothetical protein